MNDLGFAFRQLLKNPDFAAVAVFTLALGIGATASVWSEPPPRWAVGEFGRICSRLLQPTGRFRRRWLYWSLGGSTSPCA